MLFDYTIADVPVVVNLGDSGSKIGGFNIPSSLYFPFPFLRKLFSFLSVQKSHSYQTIFEATQISAGDRWLSQFKTFRPY